MIAPRTAPLPHAQAIVPPHISTVVLTGAGFSVDAGLPVTDGLMLIGASYVGEVLSCHATAMRDGTLERPSSRTWQRDASLGANTLTIAKGHAIDALRFVAGPFARVACMVTTQARHWYETDTQRLVEVTAPDNVLVSGQLASGSASHRPAPPSAWKKSRKSRSK